MKKIKKLGAVLLASVFMISTVACGSTGSGGTDSTDTQKISAEERLADSQKKMADVESVHMSMDMNIGMKIQTEDAKEQEVNMNTTSEIDMFQNPLKMKMAMTMDLGDLLGAEAEDLEGIDTNQTMEMYMDEVDGKAMMYMTMFGQWLKQEMDLSELTQYDTEEMAKLYTDGLSDVKEVGTEEINGETTTKIEGVINGDSVQKILAASGMEDYMTEASGLDQETLDQLLSEITDFKMAIWLNEDNYMVKVEEDLTEMINVMMENMLEGTEDAGSVTYTAFKMIATYSKFNQVEDFTIPEEAKNAEDISGTITE